jgi:trans-AT polyketide synthase, acyltransferase and oxidoreductase domains
MWSLFCATAAKDVGFYFERTYSPYRCPPMTDPFQRSTNQPFPSPLLPAGLAWQGDTSSLAFNEPEIQAILARLEQSIWALKVDDRLGFTNSGSLGIDPGPMLAGWSAPVGFTQFGDPGFCQNYGTRFAYYAGAMANAISSENLVIALGAADLMGSFGSGGCSLERIESAIQKIQTAIPGKPYAVNLLNNPNEPILEQKTVELLLRLGVRVVEASAYLIPTANLAWYRAAGLSLDAQGKPLISNHIIAKLSRKEVAIRFLEPAPAETLAELVKLGRITPLQAELAQQVPLADDITVEADSGGHTDNRPLVSILPAILSLRDEVQAKNNYAQPVRIGAAGGIATPASMLAAFMLGAAYVATGSINQACTESGASAHTKKLLAQAEITDVAMAPAGDMFEMGVKVQVLKRGTMFAMRAQKLYELYTRYESWEEIPQAEREKLETGFFKRTFEAIWEDCVRFFSVRDPRQLERAEKKARDKMALVFRWYLGMSSRWSATGEPGREMDYQIWCGPSMGAFNDWTRGTPLAEPENRHVVDVAEKLMAGCAYLYRLRQLEMQGIHLPLSLRKTLLTP